MESYRLDHLIHTENDTNHLAMDSMVEEEELPSFDEHISVTGMYLYHDSCIPDYVCDVYHNEHMNCL